MAEISPLLIEKYKRWRADSNTPRGGKTQPGTINTELALLSRIFSMAVDNQLIDSNPCSRVRHLREPQGRTRVLSRDEETRLTVEPAKAGGSHLALTKPAIGTGMRQGELRRLEWARVDFARGLIHVTETKSGRD